MEEMKKIPIVMDFDTGTDDAVALITALLHRDMLDVCAVTAVAGNVPLEATAANTLNIVDALGHTDIPVAKGADKPLKRELHCAISHGKTGLGDVIVPDSERGFRFRRSRRFHSVPCPDRKFRLKRDIQPYHDHIQSAAEKDLYRLRIHIGIEFGCLRHISSYQAAAHNIHPLDQLYNVRVSLDCDRHISLGAGSQHNQFSLMRQSRLPIWARDRVEAAGTPEAKLAVQVMDFMIKRNKEFGYDVANLHDVVAFCAIVNPSVLKLKKYYVDVETEGTITRGMTVADFRDVCPDKEKNITCAEDIDVEAFWNWFVDVFEKRGKRR